MRKWVFFVLSPVLVGCSGLALLVWASLPRQSGEAILQGLHSRVEVGSDALAIPTIKAQSREDAMRALGWLHARDRLFQMELLRRKTAGRLAELFGIKALEFDRRQRHYGFEAVAKAIVARLSAEQRRVLDAYVGGVNAYLRQAKVLPPEFLLLRSTPEPWRAEDSLLVGLAMFQTLNAQEEEAERMFSVMEQALPKDLLGFLTPDSDVYDSVLVGGPNARRPAQPVPVEAWAGLGRVDLAQIGVDSADRTVGSNQWVVGGGKTRDGRAILANDMHLKLGVPNIWYRASLRYEQRELDGVTLPGLPLLVVGSNGRVAWGFTNVDADVVDLVRLETNPANPDEYRTPEGWRPFERRMETIAVKDGEPVDVEVKSTLWGPVSPALLLGQAVAVHWTALQADAVDLTMMDFDRVDSVAQAMDLANRAGGPTQNVALADSQGHIGWTLLGRYPLRKGFDGASSQSWADGSRAWEGYIPPQNLPRLVDPPQGFISTANNRTVGRDYPYPLAHNQANAYRAHRIAERLAELDKADEADLLGVQQDTRSEFFEFYRRLALELIAEQTVPEPDLLEARDELAAWDGLMAVDSRGIGLLWRWREKLAAGVFAPVVAKCRQAEERFDYSWREMETPLRALLTRRIPETRPDTRHPDWRSFILGSLTDTVRELKQTQGVEELSRLSWGKLNRVPIRHPFSAALPWLSPWLDMEEREMPGCAGFCVRILGTSYGASERLVVSPGHAAQGILHMPGGQSGHPLSAHYRDQQAAWREGRPLPLLPGPKAAVLALLPGP